MTTLGPVWLEAVNLHYERAGRALFTQLNLKAEAGSIVQVEGPNGAGKTSLLRLLAGITRLGYSGELLCQGQALDQARAVLQSKPSLYWSPSSGETQPKCP